jgi:hypothetical protein
MSAMSEAARSKARSKVERLTRTDPNQRVDASDYRPPGALDGDIQTGMRPLTRRAFKSGGKVLGEVLQRRADRKPRATGGRALVDDFINRDVRAANEKREGIKHRGGFAGGGLALPAWNDPVSRATGGRAHGPNCQCSACGGRVGRDAGGRVNDQDSFNGIKQSSSRMAQGLAQSAMRMTSKQGTDPYNSQPSQASNYRKLWTLKGGRPERKSGGGNWIAGAIKHPGALHKSLHVEQGEKIPAAKLAKAAHSKNSKLAARARLAETLKKLPHKAGGGAINDGTRPAGGRLARKGGGRAKKGMNVNIIIAPSGSKPTAMPPLGMIPPGGGPVGLHQGLPPPPPPGAAAPMGPPAGGLPMRKRGGKVDSSGPIAKPSKYPIESGGGGGLARLEKARAYGP